MFPKNVKKNNIYIDRGFYEIISRMLLRKLAITMEFIQ